MPKYYSAHFLRFLRNQVPIDEVIIHFLHLKVRNTNRILRFRCPVCGNFHTATAHKTNLARCFDCQKNFNPIDLVIAVAKCSFLEAVEFLTDRIDK
jgi:hypothetical protein